MQESLSQGAITLLKSAILRAGIRASSRGRQMVYGERLILTSRRVFRGRKLESARQHFNEYGYDEGRWPVRVVGALVTVNWELINTKSRILEESKASDGAADSKRQPADIDDEWYRADVSRCRASHFRRPLHIRLLITMCSLA